MHASRNKDSNLEKARGAIYGFFSALFLKKPDSDLLDRLLCEGGFAALEAVFPDHSAVEQLRDIAEDYRRGALKAEDFLLDFEALFRVPCSRFVQPFETVYRQQSFSGNRNAMLWGPWAQEVARAYAMEGLGLREDFTELPDHVGVELEFMAVLCREAGEALERGDEERAAVFQAKQRGFLDHHLFSWCRRCLDEIQAKASTPLYRCLASLLRSFLEDEKSYWPASEMTDGSHTVCFRSFSNKVQRSGRLDRTA